MKNNYIIGIDEVGRGPLAGPVAVSSISYKTSDEKFLKKILKNAKDSKKMTEKQRLEIFNILKNLEKEEKIYLEISFVSAKKIDEKGINWAIQKAFNNSLKKILLKIKPEKNFENIILKMDYGLKADKKIKNQESIIKGDQKEFSISLASIYAKVLRDKKMIILSKKYPEYFFDQNKGYGTKKHMKVIQKTGPSEIHRKTFLKI